MTPLSIDIINLAARPITAGPTLDVGLRAAFVIILLALLVVVLAENAQEHRKLRSSANNTLSDEGADLRVGPRP